MGDRFAEPRHFVEPGDTCANDWLNHGLLAMSAVGQNEQFGTVWFGNKMVAPLPAPSKCLGGISGAAAAIVKCGPFLLESIKNLCLVTILNSVWMEWLTGSSWVWRRQTRMCVRRLVLVDARVVLLCHGSYGRLI